MHETHNMVNERYEYKELGLVRRAIAAAALLGLLLSGCTQTSSKAPVQAPPPTQSAPAVQVPPTDDEPATQAPEPTKPPAPVNDPDPPETVPEPPQTSPKPTDPDIRWYPRGIGHPLVSDDERAVGQKVAMLTFDDGPEPKVTPTILDILKQEGIKAVFFVTGYGARHKELIERIHREGHIIGTHTQNHELLTRLTREQIIQAIEPVNATVEEITGVRPRYFRPPHGAYNQLVLDLMDELQMELINWSNGSLDWDKLDSNGYKDPALIVQSVWDQLHPGAVILFHDTHRHTADALPEVIRRLREAGYQFVSLP